ncbi:MAG: HAMP domain-containing histidine kinase [Xanthomonadales bacterium]|nr:HAMP domain-containing histidine kinase [Xanthomonadales bacterium]
MSFSWRNIRVVFLLQVAIASLVVLLCMLGLAAAYGQLPFAGPVIAASLVALGAIGMATWMGYRATKRMLAPVHWMLREVSRWDPARPDTHVFAPERIPTALQGDARKLAAALHGLGSRVDACVARERDFTRDASHELRTPLTVIRMAADLMAHDDGLSERSRRSLARIQSANASMEALMEALLLLARDEHVPLETEDFQVRDIVEDAVARLRADLEGKPVALEVEYAADPVLHAPPRVLGVMLGNLLSNAIRFTDAGSIRVRLQRDRIEVEDTGIGMDAALLARAFEPFYRGDGGQGGPGLGLSIAHRLGQRCGWPLQLESTPGVGTRAAILLGASTQDHRHVAGASADR